MIMELELKEDFPVGMKILLVDDDPCSLTITAMMLRRCKYDVASCSSAIKAISLLREHKGEFDLVITDVHMPEMDGFELLEAMNLEFDLPVVMLSGDVRPQFIIKGIKLRACEYLVKPVSVGQVQNIWQHVYRKKLAAKGKSVGRDNEETEGEGTGKRKRIKRVTWTKELHKTFTDAVCELGIDRATPKRILDLMGVPYLRKEHIASHLQKFKVCMRKTSAETPPFQIQGLSAEFNFQNQNASWIAAETRPELQQFGSYQPPLNPVVTQELPNYCMDYNGPFLMRQAENVPILIVQDTTHPFRQRCLALEDQEQARGFNFDGAGPSGAAKGVGNEGMDLDEENTESFIEEILNIPDENQEPETQ